MCYNHVGYPSTCYQISTSVRGLWKKRETLGIEIWELRKTTCSKVILASKYKKHDLDCTFAPQLKIRIRPLDQKPRALRLVRRNGVGALVAPAPRMHAEVVRAALEIENSAESFSPLQSGRGLLTEKAGGRGCHSAPPGGRGSCTPRSKAPPARREAGLHPESWTRRRRR